VQVLSDELRETQKRLQAAVAAETKREQDDVIYRAAEEYVEKVDLLFQEHLCPERCRIYPRDDAADQRLFKVAFAPGEEDRALLVVVRGYAHDEYDFGAEIDRVFTASGIAFGQEEVDEGVAQHVQGYFCFLLQGFLARMHGKLASSGVSLASLEDIRKRTANLFANL
jgi:hypothetical protein